MKFRRIYWVTEQLDESGRGEVTGVYTSIPDLVEYGLFMKDHCDKKAALRLTLCELDATKPPLVRLTSPDFGDVEQVLEQFVKDGEITHEDVVTLADALKKRVC